MAHFEMHQLDELPAVTCPCGQARRAFQAPDSPASVHVVDISCDSRPHYHKHTVETYVVLEGEGEMELDGQRYPIRPMTVIRIHPGCRHRAIGRLRIVNVCTPPFDGVDEYEDS